MKSQSYRWPFSIREMEDVPDNFREVVKDVIGERVESMESAAFIPPVDDAWITGRTTDSFVLVHFKISEEMLWVFQENRKGKILSFPVTVADLRNFSQRTGLLLGRVDLSLADRETAVSIAYKQTAERYLRPMLRSLLASWLRIEILEGSADLSRIQEEAPYHFRTAAADFLPERLPILQQVIQPETELNRGIFRKELIPASLCILTPAFLLLVEVYQSGRNDWGHVVTILSLRNLESIVVGADLKQNIGRVDFRIREIESVISLKIDIAHTKDFSSLHEAVRQLSMKR